MIREGDEQIVLDALKACQSNIVNGEYPRLLRAASEAAVWVPFDLVESAVSGRTWNRDGGGARLGSRDVVTLLQRLKRKGEVKNTPGFWNGSSGWRVT